MAFYVLLYNRNVNSKFINYKIITSNSTSEENTLLLQKGHLKVAISAIFDLEVLGYSFFKIINEDLI